MSKRDPTLLLGDIVEAAEKILNYTDGLSLEAFSTDSKTVDAVIRNFQVIGEAANRLPDDFKDRYHQIDWHRIRGLRNRIIYDYLGIDYSIVWHIKEKFLPGLIDELRNIPS